ncbi:MAG: YkgJ family cysteine cluster protein [Pyramidobacter sp.]
MDSGVNTERDISGLRKTAGETAPVWFAGGLHFQCLGCGRCCRGLPGSVYMRPAEELRIAAFLGLTAAELRRRYETSRWSFPSLRERADGACVMLQPGCRCGVYVCRPLPCRTWPWWPQLLESPEAWNRAASHCPGMNSGPLWRADQILKILNAHLEYHEKLRREWRKEAGAWKAVSGNSSVK